MAKAFPRYDLIAVGADPEVFLVHADGSPQSVEGLIGGTKEKPLPMKGLAQGFAVQEDNVAAEYNIPPVASAQLFDQYVGRGLNYIRKLAKAQKLDIALMAAMDFPAKQLATPHAQRLGCDPDWNAWTKKQNPRPKPPGAMRTAAGHVHVSFTNVNEDASFRIVRALDVYLGLPEVLVTPPSNRRKLYGQAGACRLKKYGVEYRVPSNFWLGRAEWRRHVFNQVQRTLDIMSSNPMVDELLAENEVDIRNAINEHQPQLAAELMAKFEAVPFPA